MLKSNPKDIAKYFRDSVTFDFSKQTITSFQQILRERDDFFALLDRGAFSALLNDCLSYDNQLVDIFKDLNDAELGIQKFAEKIARSSPRQYITHFLNQQKYSYHQSDTTKVYVAINTWLMFFGENEIATQWTTCPFCDSNVVNGVCTSRLCKKTASDFASADKELSLILQTEASGKPGGTPPYWEYIKSGSEFYTVYKSKIEQIRQKRMIVEQAKFDKIRNETLARAEDEIKVFLSQIEIESGKESPDFDALLKSLTENSSVVDALKLGDVNFKKKLEQCKQKINLKKEEIKKKKSLAAQQKDFDKSVLSLIKACAVFEAELKAPSLKVAEIKKMLADADKDYSVIAAGLKAGFSYEKSDYAKSVKKYVDDLRAKIADCIDKGERSDKLFDQQSRLTSKVNALLLELNSCLPGDNKASVYAKRFVDEVEKNNDFALFRTENPEKYSIITNPFREKLQDLQQEENQLKVDTFAAEANSLYKKISAASPKQSKYNVYNQTWKDIQNRYSAISSNSEFKKWAGLIDAELTRLYKSESELINERKKRKNKAKVISIVLAAVIVASALGVFMCEWSGVLPKIILAESPDGFFGQTNGSYITVTGVNDDRKQLTVSENARLPWTFKDRTVTQIGPQAFKDNNTLESIRLPQTLAAIDTLAFANCSNLKQVYLTGSTPPTVQNDSFDNYSGAIYVPEFNYEAYLSDSSWNTYADSIFPDYENADGFGCIILDANGGSKVASVRSHLLNSVAPDLPVPSKEFYVFAGWYLSDGTEVESGSTVITKDVKLKARWTPIQYKITYELGGGELNTTVNGYNTEERVVLPVPQKYSYTFDGWYTNPKFNGTAIKEITVGSSGDLNLYAKWIPNNYKILFVSLGVTKYEEIWYVGQEVDFAAPAVPSSGKYANGYMFAGWSTMQTDDGNGNADYTIAWNKIPEWGESGQTKTLYAVWETTPSNWFDFAIGADGNSTYIVGLTQAWMDYDGNLDKYNLYLPSTWGDRSITAIMAGAFATNGLIKFVSIPDTIVTIRENAFRGCVNLKNVTGGKNVEFLGRDAFTDTYWFDNSWDNNSYFLSIGKVLIKYNPLAGTNVAKVNIPDNFTTLGYGLFKGCYSSAADGTLSIPDNIRVICDEAFANCGNLNIALPLDAIDFGTDVFADVVINVLTVPKYDFDLSAVFKFSDASKKISVAQLKLGFTDITLSLTGDKQLDIDIFDAANFGLSEVTLKGFGNVGKLNLNGNNLKNVKLSDFGKVGTLNLHGNKLTTVTLSSFDSIGTLNLYDNAITSVSIDNIPVTSVDLMNNKLASINITNIYATRLMLAGNPLGNIVCNGVNEYVKIIYAPSDGKSSSPKLTSIDFARNLPNLWSLDIANNSVSSIAPLANLTELCELYLGGNPVVQNSTQMQALAGYGFCEKLVRLNLGGGTGAKSAILDVVKKCTNLTWLQIYGIGASSTDITNAIKQSTHSKLQYLKISHNLFTTVPKELDYIKTVVIGYEDTRQDVE